MFDRDELAKDILLKLTERGSSPDIAALLAYKTADAMIGEKSRSKIGFVRFCIGPVTKQPKVESAKCRPSNPIARKGVSQMAFVLKDDEQVTATLEFFDKKGKKIASPKLDGVPAWASTDNTKVSVAPAADGLSALIVAVGSPEDTATITATADADLGEGVREVTTTGDVSIIGGDVATSNMNFGAPVPQP